MIYFKSYSHNKSKIEVQLYLSDYAIKSYLATDVATDVATSQFA